MMLLQGGEPGTRPNTKQLLARGTACLLTTSLLAVSLWTSLPTFPQNIIPNSNPRKLLSSNASDESPGMYNASAKQEGGFGGGGSGPVPGACADDVSSILLCNYESTPILPKAYQYWSYWSRQGTSISLLQCNHFHVPLNNQWGNEWSKIFCSYKRQGQAWWNTCQGGWFTYRRESHCVGEYRCTGNPVVCTKGSAQVIVPR